MATEYQQTPQASKGNAFCWRSWQPQIAWHEKPTGQDKRSETIERKRSEGIDPLHIAGLSSGARQAPLETMRFSILSWRRR